MSLVARILSNDDRGWFRQVVLGRVSRSLGRGPQTKSSQTCRKVTTTERFRMEETHPPSRRPYELAGETIQSK